ncbi:MAG TPA: [LysW]-lysine hydrolase [Anaerolineaceae bacterium]|nr:[LysW]-lysine hydrolase [Anaerolineaceae bacterium]
MDAVDLLHGLLEVYSPTGSEAGAVETLVGAMRGMGFRAAADDAGNAVGVVGDGPKEILLLGHIDTVLGEIPVRRDGERLYGRGAVDAKGPLACFAAAAARVRLRPGWRIAVIGAVGEEGDSPGARYLCRTYPAPEMVIIGEPSNWDRVTLGYKGSLWLTYTLRRSLAHTAARVESAAEGAVRFWNNLARFATEWNNSRERIFDQLTPTLREMNTSTDGFSETARLKIGLRIPPGLEFSGLEAALHELAGDGELFLEAFTPAYQGEKNTSLVRALLSGIRKAGGQPGFVLKTGTADLNLVGPAWNVPAAAYGPGDSNLDHTPEEHILIPEYLKAIEVLVQALEMLMD